MAIDPSAVWDFAREVVGVVRPDRGRTLATVTRVDADGTTWVTTGDGGEAPASSVAAGVSVGDTVTLEWDGSAMGIRGNVSNPSPAGSVIRRAVERTRSVADAAQRVADAVNQHFFADTHGIHVTEATQEEWDASHTGANVLLNSAGQLFRDGLNNLLTMTVEDGARALTIWDGLGNAASNMRAVIGEVITLGKANESHAEIDHSNLKFIDNEGMTYFHVGDLRDENGLYQITGESHDGYFYMEPVITTKWPIVADPPSGYQAPTVTIDGSAAAFTVTGTNQITLTGSFSQSTRYTALVSYMTNSQMLKEYTVGVRGTDASYPTSGAFSYAEGYGCIAAGEQSHAEGYGTKAIGPQSHAEGYQTTASAGYAHAEGIRTTASHTEAHAEGYETVASGVSSHAQNEGTIASGFYQTAMGRYNVSDPNGNYAIIVGNGSKNIVTGAITRSNALTVGWDGSIGIAGTTVIRPDTGWVTVNTLVRYRIRNGICFVYGWSGGGGTAVDSGGVAVATLPAAARPSYEVTAAMSMRGNAQGQVNIATNGVITGWCWTASRVYWGFMLSYPVDY